MNNPAAPASSAFGSADPEAADGMQALRTGLELARASQLTMLRLQLALHKSNRRTAMQAVDEFLDIDAEMEGLAATLTGIPAHPADDAALSGFIGLQKAAIAVEKHALTGGDWPSDARHDARPIAIAAPDDGIVAPDDGAGDADLPAPPPVSDDMVEDEDHAGSRRWIYGVAAAIVAVLIGLGLTAYLWPALPAAIAGIFG